MVGPPLSSSPSRTPAPARSARVTVGAESGVVEYSPRSHYVRLDACPGAVIVGARGVVLARCEQGRPGVWQTTDAATVPA